MNEQPQIDPDETPEAIQGLRDAMQRDVRGRTTATERRPQQKPGVSPLAVVASALGSLFVGAFGMSLYDGKTETPPNTPSPPVDIRADLEAAMSPHLQQLEQLSQSLASAERAVTEDLRAQGLLLDRLTETVASLEKSAEVQNAAFQERVEMPADELNANIARESASDNEPRVAARPPIPVSPILNFDGPAVPPVNAAEEASEPEVPLLEVPKFDVAQAEAPETGGPAAVTKKPAVALADEPERGELIIDNPSKYDLKLLINGEPLEIKARGVTTIDVTVGTVQTQIASFPQVAQTWDKWETVEGVKRLTINVESGRDFYKLR